MPPSQETINKRETKTRAQKLLERKLHGALGAEAESLGELAEHIVPLKSVGMANVWSFSGPAALWLKGVLQIEVNWPESVVVKLPIDSEYQRDYLRSSSGDNHSELEQNINKHISKVEASLRHEVDAARLLATQDSLVGSIPQLLVTDPLLIYEYLPRLLPLHESFGETVTGLAQKKMPEATNVVRDQLHSLIALYRNYLQAGVIQMDPNSHNYMFSSDGQPVALDSQFSIIIGEVLSTGETQLFNIVPAVKPFDINKSSLSLTSLVGEPYRTMTRRIRELARTGVDKLQEYLIACERFSAISLALTIFTYLFTDYGQLFNHQIDQSRSELDTEVDHGADITSGTSVNMAPIFIGKDGGINPVLINDLRSRYILNADVVDADAIVEWLGQLERMMIDPALVDENGDRSGSDISDTFTPLMNSLMDAVGLNIQTEQLLKDVS